MGHPLRRSPPPCLSCLAGIALACLVAGAADARTFVLAPDGTGDVPTFQAGVDALAYSEGRPDTLLVMPGQYDEWVRMEVLFRWDVIHCPGGAGQTSLRSFHLTAGGSAVEVSGLSVADSVTVDPTAGPDPNVTFSDCRFAGPVVFHGRGDASGSAFQRCAFLASALLDLSHGFVDHCEFLGPVSFRAGGDPLYVRWCVFAGRDTGATVLAGYPAQFQNCLFTDLGRGIVQRGPFMTVPTVDHCLFSGLRGPAVEAEPTVNTPVVVRNNDTWMTNGTPFVGLVDAADNLALDPQFCDAAGGDFHVASGSACAPSGPYGQIGPFGVGCGPAPVAVSSDLPARLELTVPPLRSANALTLLLALPGAKPAAVDVFDVAGRRLLSRDLGALEPGRHRLQLEVGEHLAAGMYLLRLRQAGAAVTARALVLR